jgi:hypothetical protein
MSEGFGLGDGMTDLSSARALAESRAADARRGARNQIQGDRWPSLGTTLRVIGVMFFAIVLSGWVLTALNA